MARRRWEGTLSRAAPLAGTSLRLGKDWAGKDQAAQARPPALPWHKESPGSPPQAGHKLRQCYEIWICLSSCSERLKDTRALDKITL